jgi:hypothetical protein
MSTQPALQTESPLTNSPNRFVLAAELRVGEVYRLANNDCVVLGSLSRSGSGFLFSLSEWLKKRSTLDARIAFEINRDGDILDDSGGMTGWRVENLEVVELGSVAKSQEIGVD